LERLRRLIDGSHIQPEQKAVLGLIEQPKLSLADAFDRFWNYIQDEWMRVSHDQQRVKRNVYLKAMRNFETAVGVVPFHKVERRHAVEFRSWWVERLKAKGLKPYTGNREINSLRRLFTVNFDIDGQSMPNPFSGVRLKETAEVARIPLSTEQIQALLQPEALASLHEDFQRLFRLLINTGMRPVEAIGLELADVNLDHEVPHVHVRKNSVRGLKTDHSERLLPLLGVSLCAAQELVDGGGWGKRLGKNMYATSIINRRFREGGLVTDPRQSLYSLRHWFQDQLTKRDVVDRAQAQLMGHKFQRPKYGYGKDLDELRDIVAEFAIGA
jgi:integrase